MHCRAAGICDEEVRMTESLALYSAGRRVLEPKNDVCERGKQASKRRELERFFTRGLCYSQGFLWMFKAPFESEGMAVSVHSDIWGSRY
jgi:hypothetical protein